MIREFWHRGRILLCDFRTSPSFGFFRYQYNQQGKKKAVLENFFPSANTTVTSPSRAHFRPTFFIFPFATTTVKGPAFSKSGNKKKQQIFFKTYCLGDAMMGGGYSV